MGSPKSSVPCSNTGVGVPGREMGGEGGLGAVRSRGNDELEEAGSIVFPEVNLGGMTVSLTCPPGCRFPKVRLDRERALFPFWMLGVRMLERGVR